MQKSAGSRKASNHPSLQYRKIRETDLPLILRIGKEKFGSPQQYCWDWNPDKLKLYLDESFGIGMVCTDGKEIVAFILAQRKYSRQRPGAAWIPYILVNPAYQQERVGHTLFEKIKAALKEMGATEIVADIYEENSESRRFFEKEGLSLKERWVTFAGKI